MYIDPCSEAHSAVLGTCTADVDFCNSNWSTVQLVHMQCSAMRLGHSTGPHLTCPYQVEVLVVVGGWVGGRESGLDEAGSKDP